CPRERYGLRAARERQGARVPGTAGDDRRGPGPGAAAQSGRDEHHVRAGDRLLEPVTVLLGGTATDLGVAARAQAPGERLADPDATRGHRSAERLGIGVARDEIDVARPGTDHRVDGVAAATPDADHADRPRLHAPPEPTAWPGKEAEADQHGNT